MVGMGDVSVRMAGYDAGRRIRGRGRIGTMRARTRVGRATVNRPGGRHLKRQAEQGGKEYSCTRQC